MYFVSQKPKNIRLIGTENHDVYGIGDKNGCLVIYQKDCFDAGEWDEFAELNVSTGSQEKCKICKGTMPTAAGIINSKMWIIASGTVFFFLIDKLLKKIIFILFSFLKENQKKVNNMFFVLILKQKK